MRLSPRLVLGALVALPGCSPGTCHRETAGGHSSSRAVACVPPPPADTVSSEMLVARLKELRSGGRDQIAYRDPTEAEVGAYRAWIRAAIGSSGDAASSAAPPGFVLERLPGDTLLLAERQESRRGAGAVVIRLSGAAADVVVEAPHTFFDVGTLPIAIAAFERGRTHALVVNTVHRNSARLRADAGAAAGDGATDEEDGEPSPSDVAHAERSFFLAAHEELGAAWPQATTLQFHGFRDEQAADTSAILSAAGTRSDLDGALVSLRRLLGEDAVRSFPRQAQILGGLTNVEARASARSGRRFVHIEMSRALRDRLVGDETLLGCFVGALAEGSW